MSKVIACGYRVCVDDVKADLDNIHMSAPAGTMVEIGLYFGSASVGAPITKTDEEIRAWAEAHKEPCALTLSRLYISGIVFGEFVDQEGTKFLGALLNPKKVPIMKAKSKIAQFAKCDIRPRKVIAIPYLFCKD